MREIFGNGTNDFVRCELGCGAYLGRPPRGARTCCINRNLQLIENSIATRMPNKLQAKNTTFPQYSQSTFPQLYTLVDAGVN